MKFEENWPRGFRGEVVQRCLQMDGGGMGDAQQGYITLLILIFGGLQP